ncbi:hypothetical protein [Desulfobulbus sp.]|uniref:hypothetical protein n=1 Tax=Desulfobulbus sp. TaxID=895 RepID=UPI0027BA397F|nr:hypothetical protein [Desulfobulbus sp.]
MQTKQKAVLALVLWVCMALPLCVGAEEQPAAEPQAQTAPAVPAENQAPQEPAKPETFASVELDQFIEREQKAAEDGKKMIKMMAPVSFEAKLKRQPEEKPMEYVYTAMEMSGVKPIPEVRHRMFVESGAGRIIPVYIEANAVKKVNAGLKEEAMARFQGYHVYSYAKGPAILVVDFAAIP